MTEHHLTAILDRANLPYQDTGVWGSLNDRPLEYVTIAGEDAYRAWQAVRAVVAPHSHPLVLPRQCYPPGQVFPQESPAQIQKGIEAAQALNLQQWWSDRWANYNFEAEEDEFSQWSDLDDRGRADELLNTLNPSEDPNFAITCDILSQTPHPVWLTIFPQIPSWQIPLYLQYGGWNACPLPEEHAAALAYWFRYYGAELFGLDEATLELWVAEPPSTEVAALAIAKEHFAYCDDIVFQGTMTVNRLAQTLKQSCHWYFWWD